MQAMGVAIVYIDRYISMTRDVFLETDSKKKICSREIRKPGDRSILNER